MRSIPVYKAIVTDDKEGIAKMSLVTTPAVQSDFLKFEKQESIKLSFDEDEHIVLGVALRCDFPIYRKTDKQEFYVMFDKDSIKNIYQKFMKNPNKVNLQHSKDIEDIYLIQSFIKDTEKGISPKGFEDIEDYSWFVGYKVDNLEVWDKIKKNELNGFSIEGLFTLIDTDIEFEEDDLENYVNELIKVYK